MTALPTLFKIEKSYVPDSDAHYQFFYLAQPFVKGPTQHELCKMKISKMKNEFEKQHSVDESISLMCMLFEECGDKRSSDLLMKCGSSQTEISPFAGKNVTDEDRETYNTRRLLLHVVTKLQPAQMDDMVTFLQEELVDRTSVPGSKIQNLLLLLEKACQQNVIQPHNLDKLTEWLEVFERTDLIQYVNQFEPRKQFPGWVDSEQTGSAVTTSSETLHRQCSDREQSGQRNEGAPVLQMKSLSMDSAIADVDSRDRSGSGVTDPNSLVSYHTSTELEARLRSGSTEEKGPRERSEFVSGNTASAKNNIGTAQ